MPELLDRFLKRTRRRVSYPCARWYCFRRSPDYLSFERGGKSWCWRHCPEDPHA